MTQFIPFNGPTFDIPRGFRNLQHSFIGVNATFDTVQVAHLAFSDRKSKLNERQVLHQITSAHLSNDAAAADLVTARASARNFSLSASILHLDTTIELCEEAIKRLKRAIASVTESINAKEFTGEGPSQRHRYRYRNGEIQAIAQVNVVAAEDLLLFVTTQIRKFKSEMEEFKTRRIFSGERSWLDVIAEVYAQPVSDRFTLRSGQSLGNTRPTMASGSKK
jgi:hypothetical protein